MSSRRSAGLPASEFSSLEYFDAIGIVPWWLKYCLFKSDHMEPKAVELYDRLIVPISRALERIVTPPIGKSVILVAENG